MVDQGTVLAVTIPTLAVIVGVLVNGRQLGSLRSEIRADIGGSRGEMNTRFEAAHQGLLRVEGVLDARLKHLEEERNR